MFTIIKERLHQKHRTLNYPDVSPTLSPRFCGRPMLSEGLCPEGCTACVEACPTGAISRLGAHPVLDMGRCIFCAACRDMCPEKHIAFTPEHRLASRQRQDLVLHAPGALSPEEAEALQAKAAPLRDLRLFSSSFRLRQVSAGGCNACEADCNVLTTLVYDLARFGIDFVASPRHADALVVTGPVSENMHAALWDSYHALPAPRAVIAVGACAISGGVFANSKECHGGIPADMPVDCYVPGCPPNPWTILDGLLLCSKKI